MKPSPPQASTHDEHRQPWRWWRRVVAARGLEPAEHRDEPSVTAASTSHQSGRESHQPRLSGSTPSPNPPSSIDAPITDTIAVRCQR